MALLLETWNKNKAGMKEVFKVSYISEADCFFHLNERNLGKFKKNGELNGNCIRIEFGEDFSESTYSSLVTRSNDLIADDSIGINPVYAELSGIREGDEVLVSITNAPLLMAVNVRPQDDVQNELIEKNISFLENNLLDQVKVVTAGKTIPIQLFSNIVINLKVEKLHPKSSFGQLQRRTKLVIISPSEMEETDNYNTITVAHDENSNVYNLLKTKFFQVFNWMFQNNNNKQNGIMSDSMSNDLIIKKQFAKISRHFNKFNADSPYNELEKYTSEADGKKPYTFRIVPSFFAPKEIQEIIRKDFAFTSGLPTRGTAESPCSTKIFCRIRKNKESSSNNHQMFDQDFNLFADSVYTHVVCCSDKSCKSSDILYVSDYYMKYLDVKVGSIVYVEPVKPNNDLMRREQLWHREPNFSDRMEHYFPESIEKIYLNVIQSVLDNIRLNEKINTLITGGTGSGKTYLLNALGQYFELKNLFCIRIDCKSLRKLKISNLEKLLSEKLSECCTYQPSLLIMDDLDSLTMEDEEGNPYATMYSARVGTLIVDTITSYQSFNEVFVIATGSSLSRFKDMSTDRGPVIFENIHEIGELSPSERAILLRRLFSFGARKWHVEKSVAEYVGNKTKGYNVQDLLDLVKISEFKCLSRNPDVNEISKEDFELALAEKVPLSLHGVNLMKKTLTKWEDIGGMEESKRLLKEMFEWPLQYQELYKNCPLRLQCGVLLYGAPGTGKTLIAGAVANEFGLNFISIKGPEVFSKYVGASEQGIRDLFSRAKRAKPCLLFFDEFDSLARKRGSSNEDVNDRVVNQLLTELDGVEELTGVFILAATSRPDLLDPALLRPGRIDKIVHCKLPTEAERLSILKALSKNMKFSDDVNLEEISTKTEGYSGADLQAILYAAQASLIKEIGRIKNTDSRPEVVLTQTHLRTGLAETRPSISAEDRENYSSSYEAFIASRTPGRSAPNPEIFRPKIMFA